jgi:hypothetical protein
MWSGQTEQQLRFALECMRPCTHIKGMVNAARALYHLVCSDSVLAQFALDGHLPGTTVQSNAFAMHVRGQCHLLVLYAPACNLQCSQVKGKATFFLHCAGHNFSVD